MAKTKEKGIIDDPKIKKLVIKISIASLVFLIMGGVLAYNVKGLISERESFQKKVNSLTKRNNEILKQIRDIENKSKTAKKYIQIWEKDFIVEQKELKGVDVDKIGERLQRLAKSSNLSNVDINFSPVTILGKDFEKNNIATYTTLVTIKFGAITDVDVFRFIDQIQKTIGYFTVIQNISLKRTGKVDDDFLSSLIDGKNTSAVTGETNIRIYGLGEK